MSRVDASLLHRGKVGAAILLVAAAGTASMLAHARVASSRRRAEGPVIERVARRLPSSDLALSGGSRWLRAPSMEEPTAAFADSPAAPDPDPAGAMMAPPFGRGEAAP